MFDADEQLLLRSGAPFGIVVSTNASMRVVPIDSDSPAPAHLPPESIESTTTRVGIVFWFDANPAPCTPINTMAVLHLLAVSGLTVHTIPLLRGPVLLSASSDGQPAGLTKDHLAALMQTPQPLWWWPEAVLRWRVARDHRRRRYSG